MMMQEEFQERKNLSINDIDLSLLRLSSPPYDSFFSPVSPPPDIIRYDQPKRRRLSPPQDPIFVTSTMTTLYPNLTASPFTQKQETSPYASKDLDTETMKMVNSHVEEFNHGETTNFDTYEECNPEETNDDDYEEDEEGMRIERSGDGFVIRLKCRCKLAFRVLFSDHHLYFKSL